MQFDEPALKLAYFDPPGSLLVLDLIEPLAAFTATVDLDGQGRHALFVAPEADAPDDVEPASLSVWRGAEGRTLEPQHFATLRTTGPQARLLVATPEPDRILELVDESTTRTWSSDADEALDVVLDEAGLILRDWMTAVARDDQRLADGVAPDAPIELGKTPPSPPAAGAQLH